MIFCFASVVIRIFESNIIKTTYKMSLSMFFLIGKWLSILHYRCWYNHQWINLYCIMWQIKHWSTLKPTILYTSSNLFILNFFILIHRKTPGKKWTRLRSWNSKLMQQSTSKVLWTKRLLILLLLLCYKNIKII